MPQARLTDRAVLRICGKDAPHFLQNLVTCDVETLGVGEMTFGALLTPQGKILFEFFITRVDAGFLLDTRHASATDLVKRLTFYKLRAAVTIETTDLPVSVAWGAGSSANDPRLAGFVQRSFDDAATTGDYDAYRLAHGLPELGRDFDTQSVFPHEALYDQYARGGVDFRKGCYVGQEIVSRMQHRGTARSRFVQVRGASLPAQGTPVTADGRAVGTMGSSSGEQGLALVRLDRVAKAQASATPLMTGDSAITAALPAFVAFDWPATGADGADG